MAAEGAGAMTMQALRLTRQRDAARLALEDLAEGREGVQCLAAHPHEPGRFCAVSAPCAACLAADKMVEIRREMAILKAKAEIGSALVEASDAYDALVARMGGRAEELGGEIGPELLSVLDADVAAMNALEVERRAILKRWRAL